MSRRNLLQLLLLSAIWGSSFMFIKVAVRDLAPATLVTFRLGLGALVLAPFALRHARELRARWPALALAGIVNAALPFWLLSWGETRIDSGLAALLQGATPIFSALLAFAFVRHERATGLRLLGVLLGFGGVALLVGAQPSGNVLAALAVVAMAFCYAVGTLLASVWLAGVPPRAISFSTCAASALVVAPLGLAQLPAHHVGWKAIGSVLALGIPGLGLAYLLYFAIISEAGASRAVLVTYLVPGMALVYGAVFLGEHVTATAVAGLALILGGVALGTGAVAWRRATRVRAAPAEPRGDLG